MADEYSVIYDNSLIIKNGRAFGGFDLNFLPDNVLAIQINSNGEADLEKGDRATLEIFENEFIKDVTTTEWWSKLKSLYEEREIFECSACLGDVVFSEGSIEPIFNMFQESLMEVRVGKSVDSVTLTPHPAEVSSVSAIEIEYGIDQEKMQLSPHKPSSAISIPAETGELEILMRVSSSSGLTRAYAFTVIKET